MSRRVVPLSGLPSDLVIALSNELFVDLIGTLEKEVGEEVCGVLRDILAEIDQTFSQVRHNLVHQVLTDGLRPLVEKVTLVLTDLLKLLGITSFSLNTIPLGFFVVDLLVSSFLLGTTSLILLALNHHLDLVNLAIRAILLLGSRSLKHFLLLLFGEFRVIHDFLLSLATANFCGTLVFAHLRIACCSLLLSLSLDVLQEAVVGVGDQVQTAGLAILLKLGSHQLQGLLVVKGLFWVVKKHAVLWANELGEEVMDMGFSLKTGICLTIESKTTLQVSLGLVGALDLLRRQITHLLLKLIVFSLKDHGVLGEDLLRDGETREGISGVRSFTLDFLLLLLFTA